MGFRNRSRAALGLTTFMIVALVDAAGLPTIPLGTLSGYSVVAASTVTNTGASTLSGVGLWPGTSVTGFPPGNALVIDAANSAALQAQTDLTAAYLNAASQKPTGNFADLGGMTLTSGVYGASGLTGTVTLDGAGDPNSVFIFQSSSTLITASGSQVNLVNGAQGCNVFWQVASSATLGTNSSFTGTILALTSVTVTTGVTVSGRVLARTGAVTLDSNVFVQPSCDLAPPVTTTSNPPPTTSTTLSTTTVPVTTTRSVTTTRPVTTTIPPTSTVPRTTAPRTSTATTSTVTSPTTTAAPTTSGTTTTGVTATPTTSPLSDKRPVSPVLLVIVGGTLGLLLGCLAVFARNRLG